MKTIKAPISGDKVIDANTLRSGTAYINEDNIPTYIYESNSWQITVAWDDGEMLYDVQVEDVASRWQLL